MKAFLSLAKTITAGLACGLTLAAPIHAQTGPIKPATEMKSMPDKSSMDTMGKENKTGAGGMMPMHEQMQADMKAMDDELDALVVKMNRATGNDKMDAMAAVITKMAQQRKMMNQKMAAMQATMMQDMMGGMKMDKPTDKPMKMGMPMTMPQGK